MGLRKKQNSKGYFARTIIPKKLRVKNNTNSVLGFVLFSYGAEKGICAFRGAPRCTAHRAVQFAPCLFFPSLLFANRLLSLAPPPSNPFLFLSPTKKRRDKKSRRLLAQRKGFEPLDTFLHHTISNSSNLLIEMIERVLFFHADLSHVKPAQNHVLYRKTKVCGNIDRLQK